MAHANAQAHWTIIRGGRVLDPSAHRAEAADLLIEDGRIHHIGPPGMPVPSEATLIDASDRLLIPGLINAHTHGHGSLSKGLGDRWSLELLLNAGPWLSGNRSAEDKRLAARLNAVELVRKGCTAAYDLYFEFPLPTPEGLAAVAEGYADVGVRVVAAPMMADRLLFQAIPGLLDALPSALRRRVEQIQAAPFEETVRALRGILPEQRGDPERFTFALAPTIPLHCSDEFLTACRDLGQEFDVRLHTHLAESKVQAVSAPKVYGTTLTGHLEHLGLLGPRFAGAHGIWLDNDDIARMADNGATIAHNPGSNLRLGAGIAPVRAMLDQGITVGIGTDSSSCSDNQNMFEAMRLASFVSRIDDPDPESWLDAETVFRLATEGSARVLGWEDSLGTLDPGKAADIVFLDLTHINFIPLNDPLHQIIFSEDSGAVDSVMIGGRMVLDQGRLTGIDEAALRRDAQNASDRLLAANRDSRTLAEELSTFVSRHCVGMSRETYPVNRRLYSGPPSTETPLD